MHLKSLKLAKVIISFLVSVYLFTGFVPLMHYHKDGVDQNNCPICYYYLNYQCQDLPGQLSFHEFRLFQIFCALESVTYTPKIVFLYDASRAPPQLQLV
jgi:hypothetical protein